MSLWLKSQFSSTKCLRFWTMWPSPQLWCLIGKHVCKNIQLVCAPHPPWRLLEGRSGKEGNGERIWYVRNLPRTGAKEWNKILVISRKRKEKKKEQTKYSFLNLLFSDENKDLIQILWEIPKSNNGCKMAAATSTLTVRHRYSRNTQNHGAVGVSQLTRQN